jgi:hypothetical protein
MIPERYIITRWRKDFIRHHINEIVPQLPVIRPIATYEMLYAAANEVLLDLIEIATHSPTACQFLLQRLHAIRSEIIPILDTEESSRTDACDHSMNNQDDLNIPNIIDPKVTVSKGRPRSARMKSKFERKAKRTSSQQLGTPSNTQQVSQYILFTCISCQESGHESNTPSNLVMGPCISYQYLCGTSNNYNYGHTTRLRNHLTTFSHTTFEHSKMNKHFLKFPYHSNIVTQYVKTGKSYKF